MADDATQTARLAELEFKGKLYMTNARGHLVPVEAVKTEDRLEDELVRKVMGFAVDLSAQISRFKEHTLDDFSGFAQLLDQQYGVKRGGVKGNMTFTSYDGTQRIQLAVADRIDFGPGLQSAKKLVDECLSEWSAEAGAELRAVVDQAFNVDKEGLVNRSALFGLLRLDIGDDRWQRAMTAIRDSIRVVGTKEYVRFQVRPSPTAAWSSVTIDVAAA